MLEIHGTKRHLHGQNIIHFLAWPFNIVEIDHTSMFDYALLPKYDIIKSLL